MSPLSPSLTPGIPWQKFREILALGLKDVWPRRSKADQAKELEKYGLKPKRV